MVYEVGVVVSREKEPNKSRYPITVRFEKVIYNGMQGVDESLQRSFNNKLDPDIIPMTEPDPDRGYIAFDVHSVSA